jgi:hypothetical protein
MIIMEVIVGCWWENEKCQALAGWIILRWILERYDAVVWTGLFWLRIGTTGGLL